MERKCKNCKCWDWDGRGDSGMCRAYSPKPVVMAAKSDTAMEKEGIIIRLVIPSTKRDDWCYHDYVAVEMPTE